MIKIITFYDISEGILYEATRETWPPERPSSWCVLKLSINERVNKDPESCPGEVLAKGVSMGEAIKMLSDIAEKLMLVCEGCDTPLDRCGPALWSQQRKCCPDCTHEAAF